MSLRQQAKILGIAPSYLSMMLSGKRPWKPEIKERYEQLVNTSMNTLAKSEEKMDNRQTDLVWRIRLAAEDTALSRRKSSDQGHNPLPVFLT